MTRDQALKIFSHGFEQFRLRKGYTLDQLGKVLGCGRANVHKIKEGKNFPSVEGIFSLVEDGITLEEIFGTELAKKFKSEMKEESSDASIQTNAFNSSEFRKAVVKIIAELAAQKLNATNQLK